MSDTKANFLYLDVLCCVCVHRTNPVTWSGQEMLLVPCEQSPEQLKSVQLLYQEEDEDEDYEDNELTLL